ncbi:hypothetical protein OsI_05756 [Oryza sativa Indica Group]|uniref:Uncharacterized protein n=3 Tax=Oryza TaxID=4527 RepID=Q6Z832_ORYSJ|nr:hypothetical protein OsI_05756 [Oryza sativa Indica Group]BAD10092.1 hypothetical protein [Oryza sativa Japonica Group]
MAPPCRRPYAVVVPAVRVAVLVVVVVVVLLVLLCGPCDGGARHMLQEESGGAWARRSPEPGAAGVLHRRTSDFLPPSGPSERHNARLDADVAERGQSSPPASP